MMFRQAEFWAKDCPKKCYRCGGCHKHWHDGLQLYRPWGLWKTAMIILTCGLAWQPAWVKDSGRELAELAVCKLKWKALDYATAPHAA